MLGHVPIGAGQAKAVVGGECTGAPRLCAVDHPAVPIPLGTGDHTGEIRSAAGLGQQLNQYLVAPQRRGDVLAFLFLATGVEQRRGSRW